MGASSAHDGWHWGDLEEAGTTRGGSCRAQTWVQFRPETLLFISDHGCIPYNLFFTRIPMSH